MNNVSLCMQVSLPQMEGEKNTDYSMEFEDMLITGVSYIIYYINPTFLKLNSNHQSAMWNLDFTVTRIFCTILNFC